MNILVTGGAGFIGSHIVDKYIELGHNVTVIDNLSTGVLSNVNPKAKFYQMDINDSRIEDIVLNGQFDIINHHAAQINVRISVSNPIFDAITNIIGGLRLYESAVKARVKKIIFASSGGTVYGEQKYFPADENHPLEPCSPYGISKLTNELYLNFYKTVYGIDFVALRYTNVYGPRQNPHGEAGVVAIFASKMLKGEQPIINGDGTATRDYVFVGDVVRANVLALDEKVSGAFNISTCVETDVNTIFHMLKKILRSDVKEVHGPPKAGELQRSCLSYDKFNKLTGWKPEISLEKGLEITVDFFRNMLSL
ncbi:MAG: UDP-glucose 4-epimerase [Candidatus Kapaibacterium sp.]|jgi:UDP-glucose 4-epimerase|nr:MAG: UDP-glucose 4-epimerase [Candidatus Kapabacteria bacterium]ROL57308.1 MAG: NAD-dependent epimerase/dehydratase family protein [Bacteroidetes/Chlorobi group bacterium Naka2016]